eukprot:765388-Karenia_brevis.AAC.1
MALVSDTHPCKEIRPGLNHICLYEELALAVRHPALAHLAKHLLELALERAPSAVRDAIRCRAHDYPRLRLA